MICFFTMGFVDIIGIATNYVKADFQLSDTLAGLCPMMVFFWFLVCSVPTGMLMNRIGRKNTVLISLVVTMLALLLPTLTYSFTSMMVAFSLLGIGNALLQVSLNPLVGNIVSGNKFASTLTFGQFIKAIASFSAPIIAAWGVIYFDSWRLLFPVFLVIVAVALLYLWFTPVQRETLQGKPSTFSECFALLGTPFILLSFIGIMCHVGIDVGISMTAPKILMERLGMDLADAGYASSLYFLFRTIGCFAGSFILSRWSAKKFFFLSAIMMMFGFVGLMFFATLIPIYICIALIGLGNANMFPIMFSQAVMRRPDKENEVSGLMIMGLIGGALFPFIMGVLSDAMMAQAGAIIVMVVLVAYLLIFGTKIRAKA